jgi:26S proteasome regulatory subunit N2
MNAYTCNDAFLRDNISWAALATNWNRFNATATLGMIHMGNKKEANTILQPYFSGHPAGPAAAGAAQAEHSPYQTAGAYYAYGLIHANQYSKEAADFLLDGFKNSA